MTEKTQTRIISRLINLSIAICIKNGCKYYWDTNPAQLRLRTIKTINNTINIEFQINFINDVIKMVYENKMISPLTITQLENFHEGVV